MRPAARGRGLGRMRPRLHFTAETGWINDPHGVTFHDGRYHLFHQYVPGSPTWAPSCHWGHASSPDLVAWTRHGVAIAPGDGDDGIWTGGLVEAGADTRIFYTSVSQPNLALGRIRVARPTDDTWEHWVKGDVVVDPPADLDLVAYRDPFVIRERNGWRMFVAASTRGGDALALTYTSEDLTTWSYDGVAASRSTYEREPVWTGAMWECPQLVEVGGHWVLVGSVWEDDVLHHVGYGIGADGSYRDGRFRAHDWGQLSFGGSHYAASCFTDAADRPCVIFWMRDVADPAGGWTGCLSVPFELSVRDGRLVATPHRALDAARGARLAAGTHAVAAFDLRWSPLPGGDVLVLASGSGAETARVAVTDGAVSLERPGQDTWSMPWGGDDVRVLVDGPVVEVSSGGILGGQVAATHLWHAPRGACEAWTVSPEREDTVLSPAASRSTAAR